MKLIGVTVTGADDKTDPNVLSKLAIKYPFAEWGVLLSASRAGTPRYPTRKWVEGLAVPGRFSAHYCGEWARLFLEGHDVMREWPGMGRLRGLFGRVQINSRDRSEAGIYQFERHVRMAGGRPQYIQQVGSFSCQLVAGAMPLFDRSGGKGESPGAWPVPVKGLCCGYAGGLGPDNLEAELEKILRLSPEGECWVDMESKVRTADEFDLEKVDEVLRIATAFV